jgi:outer membrane protein OmpA-like peptidoglycan-associated protein
MDTEQKQCIKINFGSRVQLIFMKLSGIEIYLEEVVERRYHPKKKFEVIGLSNIRKDNEQNIYNKALQCFEIEQKRTADLHDKIKTLLSLATFSLTFIVAFAKEMERGGAINYGIIAFSTFLLISIFLSIRFLAIKTISVPGFFTRSGDEINKIYLSAKQSLKDQIQELVESSAFNSNVNNYLADVYRSSQRYFIAALFFLVIMIVFHSINGGEVEDSKRNIFIINNYSDKNLSGASKIDELDVFFEFDKFKLSESQQKNLQTFIKKYSPNNYSFVLLASADKVGKFRYNVELSKARAAFLASILIKDFSIAPNSIELRSFGKTEYYSSVDDSKNRRVKIVVVRSKSIESSDRDDDLITVAEDGV